MTVLDIQNHNRPLTQSELDVLRTVPALGSFDGVHTGHAQLLHAACVLAQEYDAAPAVWTFSAPPFHAQSGTLTTLDEKLTLLASHGIRYAMLYAFSDVRHLEPERFVHDILCGECHAAAAVCGFNFRFGRGAAGTAETLVRLLGAYSARVQIVPAVEIGGAPVSSTRIRALLDAGDVSGAAVCLGRPYSVCLPVVHGKELGRTIGIPTINQNIPHDLQIPAHGTYATAVSVNGVLYPGVTNVGVRPSITDDDHIPNAETHIIGYHGDLYDHPVRVYFRSRLRDEMKFDGIDALRTQISADIAASVSTFSDFRLKK